MFLLYIMVRRKRKGNWLKKADASMKRRGTEGLFTKKAHAKGKSVQAYAREVIRKYKGKTNGNKKSLRLLRQAVFARNAGKFRNRRRKK